MGWVLPSENSGSDSTRASVGSTPGAGAELPPLPVVEPAPDTGTGSSVVMSEAGCATLWDETLASGGGTAGRPGVPSGHVASVPRKAAEGSSVPAPWSGRTVARSGCGAGMLPAPAPAPALPG